MMKLLVVACLLAGVMAETQPSSTPAPEKTDQHQHAESTHQHQSSLQHEHQHQDSHQSLESQQQDSSETASEEYRQLEANEVKQLLLKVVDENIDEDKDGYVSANELRDWLRVLQEKVIQDNVNRQWAYYNPQTQEVLSWEKYYPDQKQVVSWERYLNYTYPEEAMKNLDGPSQESKDMREMIRRAQRRWKIADVDADGNLAKEEFRDFIHPEESQRSGGVAVMEAIEDMDVDKNHEVSLNEYMNHLTNAAGEEKNDPNWAHAQKSHFTSFLDADKNGALNEAEMREWIVPSYDRSEAEAWRLISIGDTDHDQKLQRKEIADYHEYFLTLLPPEYWVQEDPNDASRHDEF